MIVLTFDHFAPYFQKFFFVMFSPNCPKIVKGDKNFFPVLPNKELCQLKRVSFIEEGIGQYTLNKENQSYNIILTLEQ